VLVAQLNLLRGGPFRFGFIGTLGVLLAIALGIAVWSLGGVLTLVFCAFFISLGMYPMLLALEKRKFSRGKSVGIVLLGFSALIALVLLIVLPVVLHDGAELITRLPSAIDALPTQPWFIELNDRAGGYLTPIVDGIGGALVDPNTWLAVGGGALRVGVSVISGTFSVIFVLALTIYFVASLETIKQALYSLVPATRQPGVIAVSEEIAASVGKYLNGMIVIAALNSVFTFILLSLVGVRYAGVLAALAFPITFIPLVGSVISTIIIVFVTLLTQPQSAIIVAIFMVIYMQVEAYVITPRIVGKAIQIPGSLVLIGAAVGGTLFGLLGVLVACPTIASILLIIRKVVVEPQKLR
jgi:predicted PurR-regulated permease PerM